MTDTATPTSRLSREQLEQLIRRRKASSGSAAGPVVALEGQPGDGPFPLSFAQQRLWFLDRYEPGTALYNLATALRLRGPTDLTALAHALSVVVARQAALRTVFQVEDDQPVQRLLPAGPQPLPVIDLGGLAPARRARALAEVLADEAMRGFDLATGPVLRTTWVRLADDDGVLLGIMHHIVSDGWSLEVFQSEITAEYRAARGGQPSALPVLPLRYADFSVWQRETLAGAELERQLAYWRKTLSGAPPLSLPTDHPRPAVRGTEGGSVTLCLSTELAHQLRAHGREHHATGFMVAGAAFATLLGRYAGQDDVVLGTPLAGRGRVELEGLIGFFVNTLPLRLDLSADAGPATFETVLERWRSATLGATAHQDVPFERLVDELVTRRDPSRTPLYEVAFSYQPQGPRPVLEGLVVEPVALPTATAKFDLTLSLAEDGEAITGTLEFSRELFEEITVERFGRSFETLLAGALAEPGRAVAALPLLAPPELRAVLHDGSGEVPSEPREATLVALVARQIAVRPEAPALEYPGTALGYGELGRRAAGLAAELRRRGVRAPAEALDAEPRSNASLGGSCVAVLLGASPELVVATLGVLAAGGTAVPLDSAHPVPRLAFQVDDTGAELLLHHGPSPLLDGLRAARPELVTLDLAALDLAALGESCDLASVATRIRADDPCAVLYTSGSTGTPKGVVVPHRAVVRIALDAGLAAIGPADRIAQVASPAFDATYFEFFAAFLNGACLVGIPREILLDVHRLADELAAREISVLLITSALFNQLAQQRPEALAGRREVMFGGEAADPASVAKLLAAGGPPRLANVYGPTENGVMTTAAALAGRSPAAMAERVPIGRPIAATATHLVDRWLQPVAIGAVGELVTGGEGLALGYLGRPAQTAAAFVPDQFSGRTGARLYRTGDLARFGPEGEIEFVGRADGQVKIRGHRIELGEIETVLRHHPDVAQVAVVALEPTPGDKRLVGFVVPRPGAGVDAAGIRGWLRERLPGHLVPGAFERVDAMPLSATGKIDRRALAAREVGAAPAAELVAPGTPAEVLVAGVFSEVLGVPRVSIHDDFFALGGHSLKATQLLSRLRAASGVELPLKVLFETPTVAALAARLAPELAQGASSAPLSRAELARLIAARRLREPARDAAAAGPGPFPLSFGQERLWFLDRLAPGGSQYNVPGGLRLSGPLDVPALAAALVDVVRRHETLRTRFVEGPAGPEQWIEEAPEALLGIADLTSLPAGERHAEAARLAREEAARPFDLASGQLIRATLLVLGPEEHDLLVTQHHIASDGWSLALFLSDLAELYRARREDRAARLPALPMRYAEFASWQREEVGENLAERLAFWRAELAGAPPLLTLPVDRPRPPRPSGAGGDVPVVFDGAVLAAVRRLAREAGGTPFMVLLAAWQALLGRHARQDDVVVGSPYAGRLRPEVEPLVGFFVNTVALRGRLGQAASFRALLGQTRATALQVFAHQDLPFERLVEELAPDRAAAHPPILQAVFALQNTPLLPAFPGVTAATLALGSTTAKFDLMLGLRETDEGLVGSLEFDRDLFDEATAELMVERFGVFLQAALARPEAPLGDLPWFSESEWNQVVRGWNDTAVAIPRRTIPELFAEQVRLFPDAPALVDAAGTLSYSELDRRSEAVARELAARGVGPEVAVALALERSVEMVVATLGVLKAGGFFVPLDPAYPEERLRFMLADSGARVLLAHESLLGKLPEERPETWVVGDAAGFGRTEVRPLQVDEGSGVAAELQLGRTGPEHLAYVMYTSGSTGRPKGVAVAHRAVVRLVKGANFAGMGPGEVFLQLAPTAFDAATLEIWGALLNGGTLALPGAGTLSLGEIAGAVDRFEVSVLWLTAGLFHQMAESEAEALSRVRQVLAGGDVLAPAAVERVVAGLAPGGVLINGYGPTENTTFTACHRMGSLADVARPVPIGRPISNTRTLVLDGHFRPLPVGVAGELFAAGLGLARGYLGRPGLTAERFVPNPWAEAPGERLYRTGDQVRWRPDGTLEFLGRLDGQVKLRGFRIELGEIEAMLAAHPAVGTAAALVADGRLFAFVTPAPGAVEIPLDELESRARAELPAYMVPGRITAIAELPLNANGKVDRRQLAERALVAADEVVAGLEYVAPRTATEATIAAAFAEVLGLERVSATADFFDLGGHSLLGVRLISRLRAELGFDIPVRTLFEHPTVAAFAAALANEAPAIETESASQLAKPAIRIRTSFAQQRLWFLDRFEGGSTAYHIPVALEIAGPLDDGALERALLAVVERHEALRTVFADEDGQPVQVVGPARLPFARIDLSGHGAEERAAEWAAIARRQAEEPFDLARGPLIRATLVRLGRERHRLIVNLHHIVADGGSMGILVRETGAFYRAETTGVSASLPPLPVQYPAYSEWQRRHLSGDPLEGHLAYWRTQLRDVPVIELPADRLRPAVPTRTAGSQVFTLSRGTTEGLAALTRRTGASLYMTLLAGFAAVVSRLTGQDDFAIGSPIDNRNRREIEGLIGFLVNTLVLRVDLSGQPTFETLVRRVRETALDAYAHQEVPFERLVEEVGAERQLATTPLFQVFFVLQNNPRVEFEFPGLSVVGAELPLARAKFDLSLAAVDLPEGLVLTLDYDRDLFDPATGDRLARRLATFFDAAAADPEGRVAHLPLLDAAEWRAVLHDANDERGFPPVRDFLHAGFERTAAARPDATALLVEDRELTYGELAQRSGRLAARLRGLGVGPEVLVGVCLERTEQLLVALLAVLRAGGAYVPLDPAYPEDRLAFMLADAGARVVITEGALAELTARVVQGAGDLGVTTLSLDDEGSDGPGDVAPPALDPDHLAYLIYTSGSTGRPKAVAIAHRQAATLLAWARGAFAPEERAVVLAATSVSFDLSIFELFLPLSEGGTVALAKNALELASLPARERVTLVNTVPSAMAELVRLSALPSSVRTVNLAGEPLKGQLVRQVYAAAGVGSGVGSVVNLYGPSEDTTYSTIARIPRGDEREPTIGRPIAGSSAHILDANLEPVGIGVPGELYLGGAGVARGYLGRPATTAERFVPDPFAAAFGESGRRLYKTGDLVRLLPDGRLEYLGRLDHQVKVRGFRIELGEIEAALLRHPAVASAAVLARDGELVAFWEAVSGSDEGGHGGPPPLGEDEGGHGGPPPLGEDEGGHGGPPLLGEHLRRTLPAYLVPALFVALPALPLTPNGKIDRKALGAYDFAAGRTRGPAPFVAPRNDLEARIARHFATVLGLPEVGVEDRFFDLGGHSLKATQLVSRLRGELGVEVPLPWLFESPTVAALAARLEHSPLASALLALETVTGDGPFPLSFAQNRLWFLDRLDPDSSQYNVPVAVRLSGPLDRAALAAALVALVERHETLRTRFAEGPDGPEQWITPAPAGLLEVVELVGLPPIERAAEAERRAALEARRPFDLASGRLIRAQLLVLGDREHVLVVTQHHIASDGWSLGQFWLDLEELYLARREGRAEGLAPLPLRYVEFARWQRAELATVLPARLEFWRAELQGAPPLLALPTDRPRPARPSGRGEEVSLGFDAGTTAAARALAQEVGGTLFMVLLAAWQSLLGRHAGVDDVVVGSPVAGRLRPELEPLVGLFVNTVALRGRLDGTRSFRDLVARTRATALAVLAQQDLPFERLVEEMAPDRGAGHPPICQVAFVLQNMPRPKSFAGLESTGLTLVTSTTKLDLTLAMREVGEGLEGALELDLDLFDRRTAERLVSHFVTHLTAALARPDVPLAEVAWFPESEWRQVVQGWNEPPVVLPEEPIHRLFERQVARAPGARALVWDGGEMTYGELDRRADQVAAELAARGVGPETAVALALERSPEMVVATLGVLKAGAFYVPFDASYPEDRLRFLLEDSGARLLLAHESLLGKLPEDRPETWVVGDASGFGRTEVRPLRDVDPGLGVAAELQLGRTSSRSSASHSGLDHLAYVIYTSGSTGRPKGVAVPHRGVVRLVRETNYLAFSPSDVFLQLASTSFDAATFEIWGPLLNGATLAIAPPGALSLAEVAGAVERFAVDTLFLTAGLFHQMAELEGAALSRVRRVISGGEVLSPVAVERVVGALAPDATFLAAYGPTENTTYSTAHRMVAGSELVRPVPIGRPISNTSVYVLDRDLRPVGVGVGGELLLGGAGLARGYLGRPGLTAERFVPHPAPASPGERLYRTGDRVRWRPDGSLEFLGRLDAQVKLRGFRIELGEIESVLASHPSVGTAAAVAVDGRLVAFVTPSAEAEVPLAELEARAAAELPPFMVPAAFVVLAELPLNASGKVDRRALAGLAATAGPKGRNEYLAPRNPLESALCGLFGEILGRETVGVHDGFFELGGHSLQATRLASRIRDSLQVELPLRSLFERPTPAELALEIARLDGDARLLGRAAPPLVRRPAGEPTPASYSQERLWVLEKFEPGTAAYNIPFAIRLVGRADLEALADVLSTLVLRHESLRTTFGTREGRPVQVVGPPAPLPLPTIDLRELPPAERAAAADEQLARFVGRGFDLERGPLVRAQLIVEADDRVQLQLSFHHVICDGWSISILVQELSELYAARLEGRPPRLAALPVQYGDYAAWQRRWLDGPEREHQLGYWRQRLAGAPASLDLPLDRPRPAVRGYQGGSVRVRFPVTLSERLRSLAAHEGGSLFMVLLAAWKLLLTRLSGQTDVVVGSPIAGRGRAEVEGLIGMFLNTLVLRTDLSGTPSFRELVARVRETALGAYAHQDVPFEMLLTELKPERDLSRTPFFQIFFNLLNLPENRPLDLPGLRLEAVAAPEMPSKFDLTLYVQPGEAIEIAAVYNADLFDAATIERFLAWYEALLERVTADPDRALDPLGLALPGAPEGVAPAARLAYWVDRLAGAPQGLDLPFDRTRPAQRVFRSGRLELPLPAELAARLTGAAGAAAADSAVPDLAVLAAWKLLLARLTGELDIVVGGFGDTLPLRTDLEGDPTFRELLARVEATVRSARVHRDVPFDRLLAALGVLRDPSRSPLFAVGFRGSADLDPAPPSTLDLGLEVHEEADGLLLAASFNAELFDESTVARLLDQLLGILRQAAADPERKVSQLTLARDADRELLPDPAAPLDATWHGPVHAALTRWAAAAPERPALAGPAEVISYGEYERWANRLAHRLRSLGVERGDRVAIFAQRTARLPVAVLATLKAGGVFVMLDPSYPPSRLVDMLEIAEPRALVVLGGGGLALPLEVEAHLAGRPGFGGTLELPAVGEAGEDPGAGYPETDPGVEVGPDDLAYIAFTSGSTGKPKGVMGRHGPLSHFLPWQVERFGLGPADRFTLLSGLAHDPLQRDLFTPLWLGATLVAPDPRDMGVPGRLAAWLAREGLTVTHLTPAMAQILTERPSSGVFLAAPTLRRAFLVGDVLTRRDVARLRQLAPAITVVNLYGSTETQRAVGFHEIPPERPGESPGVGGREVLPLGRGMMDVQLLILNARGGLVGIGEVGELAVRSPHLAAGYLGDEALTAAKFGPNPATGDPADRLYRTGDLGRYLPDGEAVFVGRADSQVKIRGFRIELGEIIGHLSKAPGVREAVVLLRKDGALGERLAAYVVPDLDSGQDRVTAATLREFLKVRLPAYMVPATFVFLAGRMPVTPNNKLDRRALLALDDRPPEGTMNHKEAPGTESEQKIAAIVQDVLKLPSVGLDDNFFDLGGNSLLLVQVHGRLEQTFGQSIVMVELFNHPTVRSLAAYLAASAAAVDAPAALGSPTTERTEQLQEGRDRLKRRLERRRV